jgi:uncharacterized protein (DUF433 family)
MNLPDFLSEQEYGAIRVKGHRVGLMHIVVFYNMGHSVEQLVEDFPTLSADVIQKVIAFYHANRSEVDAYVAGCEAEMERQRAAAPRGPSMEELKRRLEERERLKVAHQAENS